MTKSVSEILYADDSVGLSQGDANRIATAADGGGEWAALNGWLMELSTDSVPGQDCTANESKLAAVVRGLLLKDGW